MISRHLHACGAVAVPFAGSCLCGAVTFEVTGSLRPVINCHCGQCRKWTGHYVAATAAWKQDLHVHDSCVALTWYRSSDQAQRGFCKKCGSSLFWQRDDADTITILAGSIDGRTGLATKAEIYIDDKGDYYNLEFPQVDTFKQSGHNVRLSRGGSSE